MAFRNFSSLPLSVIRSKSNLCSFTAAHNAVLSTTSSVFPKNINSTSSLVSSSVRYASSSNKKSSLPVMDLKDPFNIEEILTSEERMIRVCKIYTF